jgi:hypothetical protein
MLLHIQFYFSLFFNILKVGCSFLNLCIYVGTILHGRIDLSTSTNVLFLLIGILCFSNIT